MNLLIDIGNTRLKWALTWKRDLKPGLPLQNHDINKSSLTRLWQVLPTPKQIAISCVGPNSLYTVAVSVANDLWPDVRIIDATSSQQFFEIKNAYNEPERLGVDRWLAIIGGYRKYRESLCIADCGTAITIDMVDRTGAHLGGLIAPGLRLMTETLVKGTANIAPVTANFAFGLATATNAAIFNGALASACGLIDFVFNRYPQSLLVLTGGDAERVAAQLSKPAIVVPGLVLLGLAELVEQS